MRFWPLFGITRSLAERRIPASGGEVVPLPSAFRRSLHLYAVDVGNSNALNMELFAMKTAPYNIHRYGIFFSDTPRHADLLVLLGEPLPTLRRYLSETFRQMPRPFGVLWLTEPPTRALDEKLRDEVLGEVAENGGMVIAGPIVANDPQQIVGILRQAMAAGRKR